MPFFSTIKDMADGSVLTLEDVSDHKP